MMFLCFIPFSIFALSLSSDDELNVCNFFALNGGLERSIFKILVYPTSVN